jgi:hypothetical protein
VAGAGVDEEKRRSSWDSVERELVEADSGAGECLDVRDGWDFSKRPASVCGVEVSSRSAISDEFR